MVFFFIMLEVAHKRMEEEATRELPKAPLTTINRPRPENTTTFSHEPKQLVGRMDGRSVVGATSGPGNLRKTPPE